MCLKEIIKLALLLLCLRETIAIQYNISDIDLQYCRKLYLNSGYLYKDFFHINSLSNNRRANDEVLHLRFYVNTRMDAHILLSVNDRPRIYDRVYEIVIGAGSNTFSTIRLNMGSRRVATNQDPRLLSAFDVTPIEIVLKKDGTLQVYIVNYRKEPLLEYLDKDRLDVHYISFSTYGKISATWYYDCEFDGFLNEIEEEKRPPTAHQLLIDNLESMASGENKTMPINLDYVQFMPQIIGLNYKPHDSILNTELNYVLFWKDERFVWDPLNYNNISSVLLPEMDIWTPSLLVINGAKETIRHFNPNYKLQINSKGFVSMIATNVELKTWCTNAAHNWPNEQLYCEVQFGLNDYSTTAIDGFVHLNFTGDRHNISTLSEWKFIALDIVYLLSNATSRLDQSGRMRTTSGDIVIEVKLARNSVFYKNVFMVPLLASQTLLLLSFFLYGYRRGALLLVVVIISAMGLMYLTKYAPVNYTPRIMAVYGHMLYITTFCYMLHVFIMRLNSCPPSFKPSACFMSLLNATPTRLLLCMNAADAQVFVATSGRPWHSVAKALNNFSCILIAIDIVVMAVLLARY